MVRLIRGRGRPPKSIVFAKVKIAIPSDAAISDLRKRNRLGYALVAGLGLVKNLPAIPVTPGISHSVLYGVIPIRGGSDSEWMRACRVPRQTMYAYLACDMPQPFAVRTQLANNRASYFLWVMDGNDPVAFARRYFDVGSTRITHDLLIVQPNIQRSRIGTRILRNAVRLYDEMGIHEIEITAGLDRGSETWPFMGFRPDPAGEWDRLRHEIWETFQQQPESAIAPIAAYVSALTSQPSSTAIWRLADIDRRFAALITGADPLGKRLLRRKRWKGILDLRVGSASRAMLTGYLNNTPYPL